MGINLGQPYLIYWLVWLVKLANVGSVMYCIFVAENLLYCKLINLPTDTNMSYSNTLIYNVRYRTNNKIPLKVIP